MSLFHFDDQEQLRLLRGKMANLLSENVALQQRVAELEREKAAIEVDRLTAALTQVVQLAEDAMAAEASAGTPFVISQFQATVNGVIQVRDGSVMLHLPQPNQSVDPNQLGGVQITVVRTPTAPGANTSVVLLRALEDAQAALSGWNRKELVTPVQDMLGQITYLLSISPQTGQPEFLQGARALAQNTLRFASEVAPSSAASDFQGAATQLATLVQRLVDAGRASPDDLAQFAASLEGLTQRFTALHG